MWNLFKDKNEINEKNVVGFASFVVMVLFAIADLTTSFIFVGEESKLVINEVIYNCNPSILSNVATSAPAPSISIGPWIQSTGHASTHAVSQVLIHFVPIIKLILYFLLFQMN